jgi:hypothetical protein
MHDAYDWETKFYHHKIWSSEGSDCENHCIILRYVISCSLVHHYRCFTAMSVMPYQTIPEDRKLQLLKKLEIRILVWGEKISFIFSPVLYFQYLFSSLKFKILITTYLCK